MSHFFAAVVVPPNTTRENAAEVVEPMLLPYSEADGDNELGWWDWWQVGGRWTGVWGEYDPSTDPRNIEPCIHCNATGTRPDAARFEAETPGWIEWSGGCNGCRGKGTRLAWATQWVAYDGDVIKVDALLNNGLSTPLTLVTPTGAFHQERWNGDEWVKDEDWDATLSDELEQWRGHRLVVVDYHS